MTFWNIAETIFWCLVCAAGVLGVYVEMRCTESWAHEGNWPATIWHGAWMIGAVLLIGWAWPF